MQNWEHTVAACHQGEWMTPGCRGHYEGLLDLMNALGADGWQLVLSLPVGEGYIPDGDGDPIFYVKRPKP